MSGEKPEEVETFDWKQTLFSNLPGLPFFLLLYVFVTKTFEVMETMDENMKMISLIVFVFAFVKLVYFMGNPIIIYKTKKGRLTYR